MTREKKSNASKTGKLSFGPVAAVSEGGHIQSVYVRAKEDPPDFRLIGDIKRIHREKEPPATAELDSILKFYDALDKYVASFERETSPGETRLRWDEFEERVLDLHDALDGSPPERTRFFPGGKKPAARAAAGVKKPAGTVGKGGKKPDGKK
ncbi:MAG: hypothetical protein LBR53_09965 [Deltaproteobacteria bacterium]|jgi:hypothetical protein|nr:hypothetical protein [Deltaproteobacteria bacterium]